MKAPRVWYVPAGCSGAFKAGGEARRQDPMHLGLWAFFVFCWGFGFFWGELWGCFVF